MTKTVDARGLACPQPIILARRAMAEGASDDIITIVDNEASRQNVSRMAAKEGFEIAVDERADGTYLHLRRSPVEQETSSELAAGQATPTDGPLVLAVGSDVMGRGSQELGSILMRAFFHTLGEVQALPDTIILFNEGVRLAVSGSPTLDDLRALADCGVVILACGTCLGYFGLKEQLAVGEVSNMCSIAEAMLRAGKVVTL